LSAACVNSASTVRFQTRHQFMVVGQKRLAIPSNSEYSVPQLRVMVREVESILGREIGLEEWNAL
jgi:hypothetical protein